jgi:predicted esterase
LPETVCLAIQGPQGLLDLGGFHWGDDIIFDSNNGGLDADAGFRQSTAMLKGLAEDDIMAKCGYHAREIVVFGFGQGGMVALNLAGMSQNSIRLVLCKADNRSYYASVAKDTRRN